MVCQVRLALVYFPLHVVSMISICAIGLANNVACFVSEGRQSPLNYSAAHVTAFGAPKNVQFTAKIFHFNICERWWSAKQIYL